MVHNLSSSTVQAADCVRSEDTGAVAQLDRLLAQEDADDLDLTASDDPLLACGYDALAEPGRTWGKGKGNGKAERGERSEHY